MSGREERPYVDDQMTPRNNISDEKKAVIAVCIVVIIIGAIGGYILTLPDVENDDTREMYQEPLGDVLSYVMATGTFDSIDVYTYGEDGGSFYYKLHAHINVSDVAYTIKDPVVDSSDYENVYGYATFSRISLYILIDGNFTEHSFRLAHKVLYCIDIRGIHFEFLI